MKAFIILSINLSIYLSSYIFILVIYLFLYLIKQSNLVDSLNSFINSIQIRLYYLSSYLPQGLLMTGYFEVALFLAVQLLSVQAVHRKWYFSPCGL